MMSDDVGLNTFIKGDKKVGRWIMFNAAIVSISFQWIDKSDSVKIEKQPLQKQ